MIAFVLNREDMTNAQFVLWNEGGRKAGTVISDEESSNATYKIPTGGKLTVMQRNFGSTGIDLTSDLLRVDQVEGDWDEGNFEKGDKLLWTDTQTEHDGPIVIEFDPPVRGAGASIQSATLGEFDGVIRAVDTNGLVFKQVRLGLSNKRRGTAIFLGVESDSQNISRIEFATTNIVEDAHADFDANGFAINTLSVIP